MKPSIDINAPSQEDNFTPTTEEHEATLSQVQEYFQAKLKSVRPLLDLNTLPKEDGYVSASQERERVVSQMLNPLLADDWKWNGVLGAWNGLWNGVLEVTDIYWHH